MKKLYLEFPYIASEFHPSKNLPNKIEDYSYGSHKKVWWLGKCGHEWEMRIDSRTSKRNSGCPFCNRNKKNQSLIVTHPNIASEWHSKNLFTPYEVTSGSHKKVWWLGKCGHEWESYIHNRTSKQKNGCPYCSCRYVDSKNCLANMFPDIASDWHFKNEIKSDMVVWNAYKKVWWLGKCGHEWESSIRARTRKNRPTGCPICRESKGEVKIAKILRELNLTYKTQVRFATCKNKKMLPFDFLVKNNILIEFQGQQHYEPVNFGGNFVEVFKNTQINDKIKVDWCEKNNYNLIVIPYWELDNIYKILKDKVLYS